MAFRGEIYAFHATVHKTGVDPTPPKTIAQGMQIPARRDALLREFDGHIHRRTFKIVDRPPKGTPIMQSFMIQSNKYDENGDVALCKARHVVDGRGQSKYPYDIETYAPNLQKESLRCLCCTAVQQDLGMGAMDFVQAFTLPTLRNDEVYKGFCLLCQARGIPFKEGQVLMLLAALYGLKNASNYWNTLLTRYLVGPVGLKQCVNDPCLFVCHKRRLYVGVHTDDCLIVGPDDVRDKL